MKAGSVLFPSHFVALGCREALKSTACMTSCEKEATDLDGVPNHELAGLHWTAFNLCLYSYEGHKHLS